MLLYALNMAPPENPYAPWERNFIEQMKRLREARNMTQSDLARALKARSLPFHQQTIQRIESGERPVRLDEAFLIAEMLDVELSTMVNAGSDLSANDLRYHVDRLRRLSASPPADLSEIFDDWLTALAELSLSVEQLVITGRPSPLLAWSAAWLRKAFEAYKELDALLSSLVAISATARNWVDEQTYMDEAFFDDVKAMVERADELTAELPDKLGQFLITDKMEDVEPAALYALVDAPETLLGTSNGKLFHDVDASWAVIHYFKDYKDGVAQEEA